MSGGRPVKALQDVDSVLARLRGRGVLASVTRRVARVARAARRYARETRGIVRLLSGRDTVVGYTSSHPIYEEFFATPPPGFAYFRPSALPILRWTNRRLTRRVQLLHRDAAQPVTFAFDVPHVMSCEWRPPEGLLNDPRIGHVFAHSEWAAADLLASGRAEVVRPSVSRRADRPTKDATAPIVLMAVGFGGMVKGLDVVARVFYTLRQRHPVRLIVAGDFGHNFDIYPEITREAYARTDWEVLSRTLGEDRDVVFRAFSREELLQRVYRAADIFLHLSRMDTYGLSVLEAMSWGLPVIATRLNAIPEMVREGETGFLISAGDLDINSVAWANQVHAAACAGVGRLIDDPGLRRRMGHNGKRRHAAAFDLGYARHRFGAVYQRMIRRPVDTGSERVGS